MTEKTATYTGEWTKGRGSEWLLDKPVMCPVCGHVMNGASTPNGVVMPEPGMFAVCMRCAAVSQYTEAMQLRRVPADEMTDWPTEFKAEVATLRLAIQAATLDLMARDLLPDPVAERRRPS